MRNGSDGSAGGHGRSIITQYRSNEGGAVLSLLDRAWMAVNGARMRALFPDAMAQTGCVPCGHVITYTSSTAFVQTRTAPAPPGMPSPAIQRECERQRAL
eukprot:2351000-Pyramimonas_sp.AAC.1